jgi:hypothetical protein
LSGVRSSCDMFARNSDLYLEVSASCLAFLLQRLASLLHLLVLALDLVVLVGQQPGLLLQLLVGLLELLLLALQFLGQRLGLLEQVLGPHVGLDGIDHDADRLRQLIQKGLVVWLKVRTMPVQSLP